jgi:hypothetical protein
LNFSCWLRQQRNLDCYVESEAISSQATQKRKAVPTSNVRGTCLKMFVCPSVHVTLVATKLLVRLFILTFNQYTYIIIRFCCITIICSDGSTVILRRVPIWIITWPRLTEYGYFSPQTRPLFIKSHAESLWAHWKCHRHSTTDSFFSFFHLTKCICSMNIAV